MSPALREVLAFAGGYLVGSVPVGVLVVRAWAGTDIRRLGTGNIGASNVLRNVGLAAAAVVALGVFLQGLLPPLVALSLGASRAAAVAAAFGAVVGYGWPAFLGFKGGRGVGTSTGAVAAISPGGFAVLLVADAAGALSGQMALGVLVGFVLFAGYALLFAASTPTLALALGLLFLLLVRRLEGTGKDLKKGGGSFAGVVLGRLLFDRRPGQRLEGPVSGE